MAICLGLSPARGDLAAELCWGWGEAEDEGPSDPLQALGLARMAATWLSSEAIPRPHAGWGCSSGRGWRSASQPPASRAPAGHSVLSRQEDFGGCGSGCLPSTPAQCPPGPGLRPPSRANSGPAGLPMVPAKPEVPGVGAPETGQAQVGQGAPRVLHRGNQSSGTVTVRLGRALCPSRPTSCAVYSTPPTVGASDSWPGPQPLASCSLGGSLCWHSSVTHRTEGHRAAGGRRNAHRSSSPGDTGWQGQGGLQLRPAARPSLGGWGGHLERLLG